MKIGFVYDILENVLASHGDPLVRELTTELFPSQLANYIIAGLKELGHEIIVIDGAQEFVANISAYRQQLDFIFNEAKGLFGPDRKMILPALCRIYEIPYLGSDAYAVTLSRNKWHTLAVATAAGVPIPPSFYVDIGQEAQLEWSHYPAIVKPNYESASIGITDASVVMDREALIDQIAIVHETYRQPALVQQYLSGAEIQVSVLGNSQLVSLPVIRLHVLDKAGEHREFLRYQDWLEGKVAFLPYTETKIAENASSMALTLFRVLGIRDYGRLDFRVTPAGELYFIESATHPHIIPESSFAESARLHGIGYTQLIAELLKTSLERYGLHGPANTQD